MGNSRESNIKTLKNIIRVSISNIIRLLSGVLVGFLLPQIISVSDYGYFKTFTLYATYIGLFHFGFSDGIYLKYGGKEYEELERLNFRFYSQFLIFLEITVSSIMAVIFWLNLSGDYRFIFICLSLFLTANNVIGYYQVISQITSRFKELSFRNVMQSVLVSLAVISLWAAKRISGITIVYRSFTVIYITIFVFLGIWYIWTYRDITIGEKRSDKLIWKDVPVLIKLGFPLTIANICSSLILTLDRQFVNTLFDNESYAVYAFAYNILALITTAISAISTVLYPKLKQEEEATLKEAYSGLVSAVLCFVFASLVVYYPLYVFINRFLPDYSESLVIFRIILPGLAISSAISIVMQNYYKALGATFNYFIKSVVILIISATFNYLAYKFFGTTVAISAASIFTMIIWYVYVENYFVKRFRIKWFKNFIYIILLLGSFYWVTTIRNLLLSFLLYLTIYITVTVVLFFRRYIMKKILPIFH